MLEINSSPHIHCGTTVNSAMRDVILALSPVIIAAIYFFGWDAVLVLLTATISAVVCEHLCQLLRGRPSTVHDGSAALTGLLLACCASFADCNYQRSSLRTSLPTTTRATEHCT